MVETVDGRLQLRDRRAGAPGPVWAELVDRREAGRRSLLGRAVGIKPGVRPDVIDATAGLGRDSAALLALGCAVTAIERSPVLAGLLRDALARAPELAARLTLVEADAVAWLASRRADVVLLDPMFAHGTRALAKKPAQYLQALLGQPEDPQPLFEAAVRTAGHRVVVKRPLHGPPLVTTHAVSYAQKGRSVRFDVYLVPPG